MLGVRVRSLGAARDAVSCQSLGPLPHSCRSLAYLRFAPLWAKRPTVPVSAAPSLWWQHAGRAVLAECRARLPQRRAAAALALRREYLATYRALHSASGAAFRTEGGAAARRALCTMPGWWRAGGGLQARLRVDSPEHGSMQHSQDGAGRLRQASHMPTASNTSPLTASQAAARLAALEARMTPSQASTYRVFAAARHSAHLAAHPALRAQWLEAMGALGSFLDLVPTQSVERTVPLLLGALRRGFTPRALGCQDVASPNACAWALAAECLLGWARVRSLTHPTRCRPPQMLPCG